MFLGVSWNQSVRLCLSVCLQNTSFCQSASDDIKLHLVTAPVYSSIKLGFLR